MVFIEYFTTRTLTLMILFYYDILIPDIDLPVTTYTLTLDLLIIY